MKFAHLADVHIGGWRDETLREHNTAVFCRAIEECISRKVDFILIAGDLFNTALPAIDKLKVVADHLRLLREAGIRVYVIPGSHDFSPTGKTMIDVFERAGLLHNVFKGEIVDGVLFLTPTLDVPTGAVLTGILGKAGMLDRKLYTQLDCSKALQHPGKKIFLFHTLIEELFQPNVQHVSLLPAGFDYYAGGHVHTRLILSLPSHRCITYPGPLFPNSFTELEELGNGGFNLWNDGRVEYVPLELKKRVAFTVNSGDTTPDELEQQIMAVLTADLTDTIVTLRVSARLKTPFSWDRIYSFAKQKNVYTLLLHTLGVIFHQLECSALPDSHEDVEGEIINNALTEGKLLGNFPQTATIRDLFLKLSAERNEGETKPDFEQRICNELSALLDAYSSQSTPVLPVSSLASIR